MSVVSVQPKSFILALFIRDDNERFLLGDNGYDFNDSQLHFAANTIENDEVVKQGTDGIMLAGQVRRSAVQSFDGYIGDGTTPKETIEQMRRDFIAFFAKSHHFRVIYVDCNRNAWQRKGGYLVDAPEVKELWQIHPEYHVGLNFEDVNYYSYDEDADGEEILANLVDVPVSTEVEGGLEWDENGAISEDPTSSSIVSETATATGKDIEITDSVNALLNDIKIYGETSQPSLLPDGYTQISYIENNTNRYIDTNYIPNSKTRFELIAQMNGSTSFDGAVIGMREDNEKDFLVWNNNLANVANEVVLPKIGGVNGTTTTYTNSNFAKRTYTYSGSTFYINGASASSITGTQPDSTTGHLYVFKIKSDDNRYWRGKIYKLEIYEDGQIVKQFIPAVRNSDSKAGLYETVSKSFFLDNNGNGFTAGPNTTSPTPDIPVEIKNVSGDNVIAISNDSDEQNYKVAFTGKNLWGGVLEAGGIEVSNGNNSSANGRVRTKGYVKVSQDTAYTISGISATRWAIFYDWNKTYVGYTQVDASQTSGTITIPQGASYLRWYIVSGNNDTSIQEQLEIGSTATAYEEYYNIELCKIGDYQDYIYNSGDKWYVHKETGVLAVDTSTITSSGTAYSNIVYGQVLKNDDAKNKGAYTHYAGLCSHAIWSENASNWNSADNAGRCYDAANGSRYWIGFASGTRLEDIKTALSGCKIVYPLATPTDTEITNQALVAQLDALLNTARTYNLGSDITTETANEKPTLEVKYYTKYLPSVVGGGYIWEAGGSGGTTMVVNDSIGNVNPVWTIYGPTTNPQLENTTTGETISYIGTIAEGQTLTIDMGEQTASLDGLNVVSNVIGDYVSLAPGQNQIIYSVSGEAGASELGWSEIVG